MDAGLGPVYRQAGCGGFASIHAEIGGLIAAVGIADAAGHIAGENPHLDTVRGGMGLNARETENGQRDCHEFFH